MVGRKTEKLVKCPYCNGGEWRIVAPDLGIDGCPLCDTSGLVQKALAVAYALLKNDHPVFIGEAIELRKLGDKWQISK